MSELLKQAQAAAAKLADQTEDNGGGFERSIPAAGLHVARLISYVEVGTHPQRPYQGKPKPPAAEAIVQFELLSKKDANEIEYQDETGKTVKKTVYPIITQRVAIKLGSRAGFFKLLSAMDYGRGNTHMAFMLGEAFIINVVHNEVEKDGKKRTFANIKDQTGAWLVSAPVRVDEEGEPQPLKVPEATVEPRLLLWDAPTVEMWNSLHISGTYTRKEGEKEIEVSKNWLQNACMEALNFDGSALQTLISQLSGDLPEVDATDINEDASGEAQEEPSKDVKEEGPAPVSGDPAASDDPLADLGL